MPTFWSPENCIRFQPDRTRISSLKTRGEHGPIEPSASRHLVRCAKRKGTSAQLITRHCNRWMLTEYVDVKRLKLLRRQQPASRLQDVSPARFLRQSKSGPLYEAAANGSQEEHGSEHKCKSTSRVKDCTNVGARCDDARRQLLEDNLRHCSDTRISHPKCKPPNTSLGHQRPHLPQARVGVRLCHR